MSISLSPDGQTASRQSSANPTGGAGNEARGVTTTRVTSQTSGDRAQQPPHAERDREQARHEPREEHDTADDQDRAAAGHFWGPMTPVTCRLTPAR